MPNYVSAAKRKTKKKKFKGKYAGPDEYKGVIPEHLKHKFKGKYFGRDAFKGANPDTADRTLKTSPTTAVGTPKVNPAVTAGKPEKTMVANPAGNLRVAPAPSWQRRANIHSTPVQASGKLKQTANKILK